MTISTVKANLAWHEVQLAPETRARVKKYAGEQGISQSQALDRVVDEIVAADPKWLADQPEPPHTPLAKVHFRTDPDDWQKARAVALEAGIPIARAMRVIIHHQL